MIDSEKAGIHVFPKVDVKNYYEENSEVAEIVQEMLVEEGIVEQDCNIKEFFFAVFAVFHEEKHWIDRSSDGLSDEKFGDKRKNELTRVNELEEKIKCLINDIEEEEKKLESSQNTDDIEKNINTMKKRGRELQHQYHKEYRNMPLEKIADMYAIKRMKQKKDYIYKLMEEYCENLA